MAIDSGKTDTVAKRLTSGERESRVYFENRRASSRFDLPSQSEGNLVLARATSPIGCVSLVRRNARKSNHYFFRVLGRVRPPARTVIRDTSLLSLALFVITFRKSRAHAEYYGTCLFFDSLFEPSRRRAEQCGKV